MPRSREHLEKAAAEAEAWLSSLEDSDEKFEDPADLRSVAAALRDVADAEQRLAAAVAAARANGRTWQRIAMVLGVSKQAAQSKYGAAPVATSSAAVGGAASALVSAGAVGGSGLGAVVGLGALGAVIVEPRPGGRWAVQRDGAARAAKVLDRKKDAIDSARAQARRAGATVVIKDSQGRVVDRVDGGRKPSATGRRARSPH